ncbi:uncharacterized protein LOC112197693 isoform X3 [Rosa chinensis]|uniref:uncharacterized protein LOC112197693 isoform X3 n=1 Tax=Rosa chinensis TaxID=74649 RepID=UPI000D089A5B|nr:uncharacterized protein LOC112197693 isoform X3 [Rosa chinensis]XP_040374207.1 uncharacterized protein LOC112197693 isoform X3 [Rosa chinensis]
MFQNSKTAESAFGAAIKVVRDIQGKSFILYGTTSKVSFVAADVDGNVPFFWGIDFEGNLVIADDAEVVKDRGKLFAPFPKGSLSTERKLRENDRVVAEGKISSTNRSTKVHCVPLGQECWKVWVDVALDDLACFFWFTIKLEVCTRTGSMYK